MKLHKLYVVFACLVCFCTAAAMEESVDIFRAVRIGNAELVLKLLEGDPGLVNARNEYKETPLHTVSFEGYADIVTLLLDYKANVGAQSNGGWTPLHKSSFWGRTEIAKLLLQHKADVNAQDCDRWTPLYNASQQRRTKIISLLLSYGATPHKPINLFSTYPHSHYRQTYAQRYESWICKTFVSRKTIVFLLSLIGRRKITDTPLLPKDMRNLIASYAISDQEREREKSSQNPYYEDPVLEWEQFKNDNPDVAALARLELP